MKEKKLNLLDGFKRKFQFFDWKLIIPYLVLMAIGVIMVYSSSSYSAMTDFSNSEFYVVRQFVFAVMSLFIVGFVSFLNNRLFKQKSIIAFGMVGILLLLLYLVVMGILSKGASAVNGANAWMNIGSFGIQPAELLKIGLILYLAVFFSENQSRLAQIGQLDEQEVEDRGKFRALLSQIWKILKKPFIIMAIFLSLVLLQPDMGGVIIIGSVCFVMFLLSGVPFKFGLISIAGAGGIYGLFIGVVKIFGTIPFLPSYMVNRFTAFLEPFRDAQDSSFQLVNSFYALARGGMFGVGLGESVQKSGFLPESHTDFIISIMAEELGLLVMVVMLTIFFFMVYRIYRISLKVQDPFGQLVCIGVATLFLIQGSINVGGAIGVMPLTGVTFPFISYGGSSILVSSLAIAIVNNIYITDRTREQKNEQMQKREL